MQPLLLRAFLFALVNVLLILVHFRLFNVQPVYGYVSAGIHVLLLILFPYSRFFKKIK